MEHLNTGNGRVVPEITDLHQRCSIRFTGEFLDTQSSPVVAVDQVLKVLERPLSSAQQPQVCAFQGAFRGPVNVATALYTSLQGYPQLSTLTSANELLNQDIYPLYGSLNPANSALPFLQFLVEELGVDHLAIVHADSASPLRNWVTPLEDAAAKYYPDQIAIQTVSYSQEATDFEATVQLLKQTGIRYIYSVADTTQFEALFLEAHQQGIAGVPLDDGKEPTHTWITWVGIATTFLLRREFQPDDPLFLASRGLLIFDSTLRSMPGVGRYDAFLAARAELAHADDVAFLQSQLPVYDDQPNYQPVFTPQLLQQVGRFTGTAAVLYDATIALGLGACATEAATAVPANSTTTSVLNGPAHYQGFVNTSFVGASGQVQLDPATGARDSTSNLYGLSNMVAQQSSDTGNWTFTEVRAYYYDQGSWIQTANLSLADGSSVPHPALPPIEVDTHEIGVGLLSLGFALGALTFLASCGCALWTWWYRKERIVRASQPVFLWLICLGTCLMGSSIFPLSLKDDILDENGKGVDQACMAVPWLLALGWCVSFSALFSKTRRVNIIFHNSSFRRVKVEAKDVMIPMAILLALNLIVLATWTAVAPLEWEREVTSVDILATSRGGLWYPWP